MLSRDEKVLGVRRWLYSLNVIDWERIPRDIENVSLFSEWLDLLLTKSSKFLQCSFHAKVAVVESAAQQSA